MNRYKSKFSCSYVNGYDKNHVDRVTELKTSFEIAIPIISHSEFSSRIPNLEPAFFWTGLITRNRR